MLLVFSLKLNLQPRGCRSSFLWKTDFPLSMYFCLSAPSHTEAESTPQQNVPSWTGPCRSRCGPSAATSANSCARSLTEKMYFSALFLFLWLRVMSPSPLIPQWAVSLCVSRAVALAVHSTRRSTFSFPKSIFCLYRSRLLRVKGGKHTNRVLQLLCNPSVMPQLTVSVFLIWSFL